MSGFTLDHDIKVHQFIGEGRHVVLKTESIFANCVGCKDEVSLSFSFSVEEDFLVWVLDIKVDVK